MLWHDMQRLVFCWREILSVLYFYYSQWGNELFFDSGWTCVCRYFSRHQNLCTDPHTLLWLLIRATLKWIPSSAKALGADALIRLSRLVAWSTSCVIWARTEVIMIQNFNWSLLRSFYQPQRAHSIRIVDTTSVSFTLNFGRVDVKRCWIDNTSCFFCAPAVVINITQSLRRMQRTMVLSVVRRRLQHHRTWWQACR